MDLDRLADLYLAESQEHLRLLGRSLLELEAGGGAASLDQAFRSAHTLKGMAATMGHRSAAQLAHELEDVLAQLREGRLAVAPALVDELLGRADSLEREIAAGAPGDAAAGVAEDAALSPAAPASAAEPPPGTVLVVAVRLAPDAALPAARALVVRRSVERVAVVLGSEPAEIGVEFRGDLRLFIGAAEDGAQPDAAAVVAAVRSAGDVESVEVRGVGDAAAPQPAPQRRLRHVRVDQDRLDELAEAIGELAVLRNRMEELAAAEASRSLAELIERAGGLVESLRDTALAMRMVPVGDIFDRFPRMVRDAARALGKEVAFRIEGREIELDRVVLDAVSDPVLHLLRNALDHGIEAPAEREAAGKPRAGRLALRAVRERSSVRVVVEDDGAGIDPERVSARARELGLVGAEAAAPEGGAELLRLLSRPGFSTAREVTELSGRGVGLDAVLDRVRSLGGSVELRSTPGHGTSIALRLPMTLAVAPALRVRVAGEEYAIPMTHVAEAIELDRAEVARVRGEEVLRLRGEVVPLVRVRRLLGDAAAGDAETAAVVVHAGERKRALAVDELVAREAVVVKGFEAPVGMLPLFSGATVRADGRPALVLDPMNVLRREA